MTILVPSKITAITSQCKRMARAKGIQEDDIDDIVQEVMLEVWERELAGKLPQDNPDAYITTVIGSKITNHYRAVKRNPLSLADFPLPDKSDPIAEVDLKLTLDELREYLSPGEKEIYDRYRIGLTPRQIGIELNLTDNNVRQSWKRVKDKLAKKYVTK